MRWESRWSPAAGVSGRSSCPRASGNRLAAAGCCRRLASLLAVAIDHERLAVEAYDAETLRRSDAVKTAVIQAVSHDLRTPLATIETALGSLRSGSLALTDEDRADLLDAIAVELERLKRLVENLLDLSRLQAGAADPVPELWTAEQLLADALDEVEEPSGSRSCVADDLPVVRVDGAQIQRVLVNLLENALKFSSPAEPVQLRAQSCARRSRDSRDESRSRHPAGRPRTDLRALSAGRGRDAPAVPGSGSRSRRDSPRRTAGGSGRSRGPVREPRSCSRCRQSDPGTGAGLSGERVLRRRRRAAVPARVDDEPACCRLRRSRRRRRARRR